MKIISRYDMQKLSIVIPAKNEELGLGGLISDIQEHYPDAEILVVDDGSTDNTAAICEEQGAKVIRHLYSKGNGAAIKSGARAATGDVIVFMDGDGQHKAKYIHVLLEKMAEGFDLVVGARSRDSQASVARWLGNSLYNRLASWVVEKEVLDLTSGFRAVNAAKFRSFLYMLPNGFSYPTTSTMAFYRAGYSVAFVPVIVGDRMGKSHLRPFKDGFKFLLIIFKIGTLYSPLRLFTPVSLVFALLGFSYYGYTFVVDNRFTNMSALLFSTSIIIFMMGLVSEQITTLMFKNDEK
jgi:glycosyltransferase involved in cell wall biosynthesis